MTRQEAIEKLSTIGHISVSYAEDLYDSFFPKPIVPQYVANWYEEIKGEFYLNLHYLAWDIFESLDENACVPEKALDDDFTRWCRENKNAIQIIVNMHQFGYEVEKDARYTVRVKGINGSYQWLAFGKLTECWWFGAKEKSSYVVLEHTRKELEDADFGWVFDCPGVEVKEVGDED